MKKATLLLALVAMMAMGTTASAQLTFSLKAGLNATSMTHKINNTDQNYGYLLSFNAGVGMEIGLTDILALEVDALFSRKGFKTEWEFLGARRDRSYNLYYIDIPVNLKAYFLTLGSDLRLFAQAGPYVGFGLFGKHKTYTEVSGAATATSIDINWGDDGGSQLKRLDYGVDFGLGLEYDKLSVGVIWWQGLANVISVAANDSKYSHHGLSVELGWKF